MESLAPLAIRLRAPQFPPLRLVLRSPLRSSLPPFGRPSPLPPFGRGWRRPAVGGSLRGAGGGSPAFGALPLGAPAPFPRPAYRRGSLPPPRCASPLGGRSAGRSPPLSSAFGLRLGWGSPRAPPYGRGIVVPASGRCPQAFACVGAFSAACACALPSLRSGAAPAPVSGAHLPSSRWLVGMPYAGLRGLSSPP